MNITFESKRGIKLVGVLENETAKNCVILVHGFMDDKNGNSRWILLSKKLQKEDYAVFRFDFGEHGKSEKASISIAGELQDLQAAIDLMKEKYKKIALVGHSLGGLCSLKLANKVDCVISWAGATDSSIPTSLMKLVVREDNYTLTFESKGREWKVDKKYLEERKELDVKSLMGPIKVPLLLIHGTKDEHVPIEQTYNAKKFITNGEIKIIQDEDHFFLHNLNQAISLTIDFIKRYI